MGLIDFTGALERKGLYLDLGTKKKGRLRVRLSEFGGGTILNQIRQKNPVNTPVAAIHPLLTAGSATLLFGGTTLYVNYGRKKITITAERTDSVAARLRTDESGQLYVTRLGECKVAASSFGERRRMRELELDEEIRVRDEICVGKQPLYVVSFMEKLGEGRTPGSGLES